MRTNKETPAQRETTAPPVDALAAADRYLLALYLWRTARFVPSHERAEVYKWLHGMVENWVMWGIYKGDPQEGGMAGVLLWKLAEEHGSGRLPHSRMDSVSIEAWEDAWLEASKPADPQCSRACAFTTSTVQPQLDLLHEVGSFSFYAKRGCMEA